MKTAAELITDIQEDIRIAQRLLRDNKPSAAKRLLALAKNKIGKARELL